MGRRDDALVRKYEGREVLEELLDLAGAIVTVDEAVLAMKSAQATGLETGTVIPSFFDGEPHFTSPELARRTFQNLLGLWDVVRAGGSVEGPRTRPQRPERAPKVAPPEPPRPFGPAGPDEAFLAQVRAYLARCGDRELQRLEHAFENRQDGLLGHLDEGGLSDEGYALARQCVFECFVVMELGLAKGAPSAAPSSQDVPEEELPAALRNFADEALRQAGSGGALALSAEEQRHFRERVMCCVRALWSARR